MRTMLPSHRQIAIVSLLLLCGCEPAERTEPSLAAVEGDTADADTSDTLLAPHKVQIDVEIPSFVGPLDPPTCQLQGRNKGRGKDLAQNDTLQINPPDSRRPASLQNLSSRTGTFYLSEQQENYPYVQATGPAVPVRLTMSAEGCRWPEDRLLVLYERVGAEWVERGKAQAPADETVTVDLGSLNSRFALGTAD